ncbi:MAG: hypothetical protein KatS3mg014_1095 [Actinomycetota bacterium]|nr:MAG: hypothetical protein KatS3mg014_1095 [Actinomycetota bacterium]
MRAARLALAAAVAGALVAAFAPLGRTCGATLPGGELTCSGTSIFSVDGWWVLAVTSVPVALSLVAALARSRAAWTACAVLLWAFCVVGILSIGLFFVPAAILMTVAAVRGRPETVRTG